MQRPRSSRLGRSSEWTDVTLLVREETADAVERGLLVRRRLGNGVLDAMARCYAAAVDHTSGRGVLMLEDVIPATQGDVLGGCSLADAAAALRALARLHAATWRDADDFPSDLPRRFPATGPPPLRVAQRSAA